MNPFHLKHGSAADNAMDKILHGRQPAKLNEKDVYEILKNKSASVKELAKLYNVSISAIRAIKTGKIVETYL